MSRYNVDPILRRELDQMVDGIHFDPETEPVVAGIIAKAIKNKWCLRIRYGDRLTGRDWMEDQDCYGYPFKSGGVCPVACIRRRLYATSGVQISDRNIIKLEYRASSYWTHGYRHPKFHHGAMTATSDGTHPEGGVMLHVDGVPQRWFKSWQALRSWVTKFDFVGVIEMRTDCSTAIPTVA